MLTLEEISAIKTQLMDAVKLCEEAERVARDKNVDGFYVIYKSAILRTVDSLRRVQASIYQTVSATRLGKPLTADSITPRAKRIAKAKQQVLEVRAQIKESKAKKPKES